MSRWRKLDEAETAFGAPVGMTMSEGVLPPPAILDAGEGAQLLTTFGLGSRLVSPLLFVAALPGEGTSSIVRDLALIAASDLRLRVLLLDLDPPAQRQATWLDHRCEADDEATDVAAAGGIKTDWSRDMKHLAAAFSLRHWGHGALHVNTRLLPPLPNGTYWRAIFTVLTQSFDIVLIDSPPLAHATDAIVLAPHVAANVIVMRAEATQTVQARRLRDSIRHAGGEIAGVILNRRRFHAPLMLDAPQ